MIFYRRFGEFYKSIFGGEKYKYSLLIIGFFISYSTYILSPIRFIFSNRKIVSVGEILIPSRRRKQRRSKGLESNRIVLEVIFHFGVKVL
jgi:hypothetical protein